MRAAYRKGRPAFDYRYAQVIDASGRLAEVVEVYYREHPPAYMAKLRRFNGEPAGEQVLSTLNILERSH